MVESDEAQASENSEDTDTEEITKIAPEAIDIPIIELTYGNAVIIADDTYRYVTSNGIPEHETGQFPNSGNPNAISAQDHSYRATT